MNTHAVYVAGVDSDNTKNVQSLLQVVGNNNETAFINVKSGHLASGLGGATFGTVGGDSTTGIYYAGGSDINHPSINSGGLDRALIMYSSANKTSLGKKVSFEFDDYAGYKTSYG